MVEVKSPNQTADEARAAVEGAEAPNQKLSKSGALEQKCVDTIRFLAVDGVEAARSGHPGTPMGLADIAFVVWTEFLRHDPKQPWWSNRDRFVLSAGHASMLLYSMLHLTGYDDVSLDELRNFRQWGSKTAGHPEYGHTAGVEVTTGPLGQGFAHGVGMALGSKMLAARFNRGDLKPVDHFVYGICSDGDLMEGISSEAASLAGHLGVGNLIYFYDDNKISIEGDTKLAFSEDVRKRFESAGWHVQSIDGHDRDAIRKAIKRAQKASAKPSLIISRTVIGWGSPNLHGTAEAHGSPLGPEEAAATKKALGWPAEPTFLVPDDVREEFERRTKKLKSARRKWEKAMRAWREAEPALAAEWDRMMSRELPADLLSQLISAVATDKANATRSLSGQIIQKLASIAPFLVGGSADLAPSNNTMIKNGGNIARADENKPPADEVFTGRNFHFGIREHAMAAIVNGLTLYGPWRAYGATFLVFADYMRPSIRLAALMKVPSIFIFTHDSVFLGEDGPTHQPIEHLWSLRAIPGLTVFRPGDAVETAAAWAYAMRSSSGPTSIVLTRQKLEPVTRAEGFDPEQIMRGAYVVSGAGDAALTIVATGSELPLAIAAAAELSGEGVRARIVSAPSLELFDRQTAEYQDEVLGDRSRVVVIEAGRTFGWYRYVDRGALVIGIDHFGASAPAEVIADKLGFTPKHVAESIRKWIGAK